MSVWETIGRSDEWYTPKYIFDAMGFVFDLDVASPPRATNCPCRAYLSARSLETEWQGFVWMNPPFGGRNGLVPWLEKFMAHANGVALVPDRTSAPWFQHFAPMADSILFVAPKVKFERPDGSTGQQPGNGTALFAKGLLGQTALWQARSLGWLAQSFDGGVLS